jgi:hypothetical protein
MADSMMLAKLSTATRMLAEARTLDDVRQIRDMAEAVRAYAKAAGLGDEAIGYASAIKLDAERKAGQLLAEINRAKPGQETRRDSNEPQLSTLADLGVSRAQSSRWQALGRLPDEAYADVRKRVETRARTAESVPVSEVVADDEETALERFQTEEQRRRAAVVALIGDLRHLSVQAASVLSTATTEERAEIASLARTIVNDATGRGRPEVVR